MKGMYVVYGLMGLCAICEIARAAKRGGKLAFIRLIMDLVCGGAAYFAKGIFAGTALEHMTKYATGITFEVPKEIEPAVRELINNLAGPFVFFAVFIVLKIITGFIFLIVQAVVKKNSADLTAGKKLLGALCGIFSAAIVCFVVWLPGRLVAGVADDYFAHRKEIQNIISLVNGGNVSTSDTLNAVNFVTAYVMETDLVSDESKVQVANFGIGQVNESMKNSGNSALECLELGEVKDMSALKEQVNSVMDVAKAMDDAGVLEDVVNKASGKDTSGEVISEETIIAAISEEKTARALVRAAETMDNGGQMLANAVNSAVEEASNGQLKNVLNEDVLADTKKNEDAIVKTLTLADTLKDMDEESFSKMSVSEKYVLISKIEELKSLGVVNGDVCDSVLAAIEDSMR